MFWAHIIHVLIQVLNLNVVQIDVFVEAHL